MKSIPKHVVAAFGLASILLVGTAAGQSSAKPPKASAAGAKAQSSGVAPQAKQSATKKPQPACRDETNPARNTEIRKRIESGGGSVYHTPKGKTRFDTLGPDGVAVVDSALKQAKRQSKTLVFSGGKECKGHKPGSLHAPGKPGDAIDVILKGATPKANRTFVDGVAKDLKKKGIGPDRVTTIYNGDKPICSPKNQKGKTNDKDHCGHAHVQVKPKATRSGSNGAGETTFVAPPKSKGRSK